MSALRRLRASMRQGDAQAWASYALAFLFGCGAVLVGVSCLLPGRSAPGFALLAVVIAGATALGLVRFAARTTRRGLSVTVAIGTVLISLVIYSSGHETSPDALLFVWPALYSGCFLGARAMAAHIGFVAVVYAAVLAALPDRGGVVADAAPQHFLMVVGATGVACLWVGALRGLIDDLLTHQRRLATSDDLTGLTNRFELLRRGDEALRGRRAVGVLLIDLDDFKLVNDGLGHSAGDRLLRLAGERLRDAARDDDDVVARLGGDEFAVMVTADDPDVRLGTLADRVVALLREPFVLGEERVEIEASVGVARADGHGTLEELLRDADLAMYAAKAQGGGWQPFAVVMRSEMADRRELVRDLRQAVAREQLSLRYQPIVDTRRLGPVMAEALLRWEHPERGTVGPDAFIPAAEATGLIVGLGRWVLREACREAATWTGAAAGVLICVNLSPRQLLDPDLVADVEAVLADTRLDPARLVLEITETSVMNDPDAAVERLRRLRAIGVSVAVDDFGTGHSSLAYLRRLPVTELKLARPFVRDLEDHPANLALARGIIDLGHALGMRVVAEGIEDAGQLARMRAMGCDLAQGFLLDRPMSAAALVERFARADDAPVGLPAPPVARDDGLALTAQRLLLATLPGQAVVVLDRELRCVALEGVALERAGWHADELLGHQPVEVFGAERGREFEAYVAVALAGRPHTVQWRSVRAETAFEIRFQPLYGAGTAGGAEGVVALIAAVEAPLGEPPPTAAAAVAGCASGAGHPAEQAAGDVQRLPVDVVRPRRAEEHDGAGGLAR